MPQEPDNVKPVHMDHLPNNLARTILADRSIVNTMKIEAKANNILHGTIASWADISGSYMD